MFRPVTFHSLELVKHHTAEDVRVTIGLAARHIELLWLLVINCLLTVKVTMNVTRVELP